MTHRKIHVYKKYNKDLAHLIIHNKLLLVPLIQHGAQDKQYKHKNQIISIHKEIHVLIIKYYNQQENQFYQVNKYRQDKIKIQNKVNNVIQ